ncbi:putative glutathione-specific gamma-glutamylcyclotransferase 2 [Glandiceps talaboti]
MSQWVFGYGSLIWKPDFSFEQKVVGRIQGFCIRFWQESTEFRGTPEKPGRMAMLVEDQQSEVWGIAYKIPDDKVEEAFDHLLGRELYTPIKTTFFPKDESESKVEVNIFNVCTKNAKHLVQYVGPEPIENTAKCIAWSSGPAGRNDEYLYRIIEFLHQVAGIEESTYLSELLDLVKKYKLSEGKTD